MPYHVSTEAITVPGQSSQWKIVSAAYLGLGIDTIFHLIMVII